MIHFLRNNNSQTIIECDVYNDDLHCSIDVDVYSRSLLSLYEWEEQKELIKDIGHLYSLRKAWWENLEYNSFDQTMERFVEREFKTIAQKWHLAYVTD